MEEILIEYITDVVRFFYFFFRSVDRLIFIHL
jgi:hypothetical protein